MNGVFCPWNSYINSPKVPSERVEQMLAEGRVPLHIVIRHYRIQLDAGRHFRHEHPSGDLSWRGDHRMMLLKDYKIETVTSHQCGYGLLTPGPGGVPTRAKKPARWASSSPRMLRRRSRRCSGKRKHKHLENGRPAGAALHPSL